MSKVCVVTIYKHNYGAFLQAYASQKYLESLGYEAVVLDYDYFRDHAVLGISLKKLRKPLLFFKELIYRLLRYRFSKQRDKMLEQCAAEMIRQTKYYRSYRDVQKNPPETDIYITGSDQVWNPKISEQGFLSRLLEFAPEKGKILCSYAASVGVQSFSEEEKKLIQTNLNRYDCISVREPASEQMIRELTDKEIFLHRDPTLLLSAKQWDLFKKEFPTDRPYLFIYLAQNAPELVQYAVDLARKNDWDIIDCHGSANYYIKGCANGSRFLSPMEFVGGIKNAAYVVTNSFHCLVFSIHYQKRAFVKLPQKGASRLSELISSMSLERLLKPEMIEEGDEKEIYSLTDEIMLLERKKAADYLLELGRLSNQKLSSQL